MFRVTIDDLDSTHWLGDGQYDDSCSPSLDDDEIEQLPSSATSTSGGRLSKTDTLFLLVGTVVLTRFSVNISKTFMSESGGSAIKRTELV